LHKCIHYDFSFIALSSGAFDTIVAADVDVVAIEAPAGMHLTELFGREDRFAHFHAPILFDPGFVLPQDWPQPTDFFETDSISCSLLDFPKVKWLKIKNRVDSELRREHMVHNHGDEYQTKIICRNGTVELSEWMNSTEQVAQTMIAADKPQGITCWLPARNIICPDCPDREQILEYPIMDIPLPRCVPQDSRYPRVVESRNRYDLGLQYTQH
jgi:hypothetical protein